MAKLKRERYHIYRIQYKIQLIKRKCDVLIEDQNQNLAEGCVKMIEVLRAQGDPQMKKAIERSIKSAQQKTY